MPSPNPDLAAQLSADLLHRYLLPVSQSWLSTFLASTRQPLPPLPALVSTAHFRILASDITASLSVFDQSTLLPPDINDLNVKERRLPGNVPVQVLEVVDVGVSKWAQVEAIERVERGEEVRGREVIRTVPGISDEDDASTNAAGAVANGVATSTATTKRSQGPHKLVLQDADRTTVTAFELGDIPKIFVGDDGMCIGCKIVLKAGTLVRRGMVMLQLENVTVLGGKIDSWDKKWREDRKKRLIADVEAEQEARRNER